MSGAETKFLQIGDLWTAKKLKKRIKKAVEELDFPKAGNYDNFQTFIMDFFGKNEINKLLEKLSIDVNFVCRFRAVRV